MLFVMLFCECVSPVPSHLNAPPVLVVLKRPPCMTSSTLLRRRYPFERPHDRGDGRRFQKILQRILKVDYLFPQSVPVSAECKDLIAKILVADPDKRITVPQVPCRTLLCLTGSPQHR